MPSKNIIKQYAPDKYYHVYSRGVAKQTIFKSSEDYIFFLGLFKRYLSSEATKSTRHGVYPYFGDRIDLISYCLMPNHIHIFIYQHDERGLADFMRSLMTSYSMYFNRKYQRVGPVFQSRYLASMIHDDSYLEHISRYIHLNPRGWQTYPYSSIVYYLGPSKSEWLKPDAILNIFDQNRITYKEFLEDYEEQKEILDDLKWELADPE